MMGHTQALQLLERTLEEEKKADRKLNELAEGGINALAERDGQRGHGRWRRTVNARVRPRSQGRSSARS